MGKIRVGIIGTGFGAEVHAPMFQVHPNFEVQAIASVYRKKTGSNHVADGRWNVYTDWQEMLDVEDLDLVCIASAPAQHDEMTRTAIHKGLHVLCEKPMAMGAEQTSAMLKHQLESGVQGYVNFQWRLTPVRQKIKEILRRKELGIIQHIKYEGSFSGYHRLTSQYSGWEGQKAAGGGILFAVGSHMIDSLMWWMDEKIDDVYAELKTFVSSYEGENGIEVRDADDAFTITGHFHSGASFTADMFTPAARGSGWLLEIFGTKGTLRMKDDKEVWVSRGGAFEEMTIVRQQAPSSLIPPASLYYEGLYPMIDSISRAISCKETCSDTPTFEDGHAVQLVLDAVHRSSSRGARVAVSYPD